MCPSDQVTGKTSDHKNKLKDSQEERLWQIDSVNSLAAKWIHYMEIKLTFVRGLAPCAYNTYHLIATSPVLNCSGRGLCCLSYPSQSLHASCLYLLCQELNLVWNPPPWDGRYWCTCIHCKEIHQPPNGTLRSADCTTIQEKNAKKGFGSRPGFIAQSQSHRPKNSMTADI